ncbi:MAG: U32 family peptidase C-terminal domain-containing protein [Candidatus Kerfeldbacteria bacterium]|nr:U32 family peptidase C-terminal domain-containing protein [Candidatus Kerfeldbacteria bacterium]
MKKIELLAPGGDLQKAQYALDFGADAVYCGTNFFAMRQHKGNFTYEDLEEVVRYAHARHKKVYVTMNIFAHNYHLDTVKKALIKLRELQPDALIVSDPGIFMLVREHAPELPVHISTQANVTNASGVQFWKKLGAERVILARELSIKEIREIHEAVPDIEIETFIHGAQCMAYSGRCMLSSYMNYPRRANIGSCSNTCRWKYIEVEETQRPGEKMRVEEDEFGTYIFNAHDMCMIEHVQKIIESGVVSLKIEGRGRSPFYVAFVVKAYRAALNLIEQNAPNIQERLAALRERLLAASSRPFDTGFFLGAPMQNLENRKQKTAYRFVGILEKKIDEHTATFTIHNELYAGEEVYVMTPDDEYTLPVDALILANSGQRVNSVHGGKQESIQLTFPKPVHERTILFLNIAQRAQ